MTWILYDKETGTILTHGNSQPTGYSADKDIAQVDYNFWEAQPDYLYKFDGQDVVANDDILIDGIQNPQKVIVDVDTTTFSITNDLNGRTLDIINSSDVSLLLQDISNYEEGFSVNVIKKVNHESKVSALATGGNTIDGEGAFDLHGRGGFTLVNYYGSWRITDAYNFNSWSNHSRPKQEEYLNTSFITVTHNRGYIPIVQVFTKVSGDYVMSNVSVDHDFATKNSFSVDFGNFTEDALILYV